MCPGRLIAHSVYPLRVLMPYGSTITFTRLIAYSGPITEKTSRAFMPFAGTLSGVRLPTVGRARGGRVLGAANIRHRSPYRAHWLRRRGSGTHPAPGRIA